MSNTNKHPIQRPLWRQRFSDIDWALKITGIPSTRIILTVILGFCVAASSLSLAGVSAWLIFRAAEMPPVLDLSVAVVSVRALGFSRGVLRYLDRLYTHHVALGGLVTLRHRLYTQIARHPERVSSADKSALVSRFGSDVDAIGDLLVRSLIPFAVASLTCSVAVVAMAMINIPSALILLFVLFLTGFVIPYISAKAAHNAEEKTTEANQDVAKSIVRVVDHASEFRVLGLEASEISHVQDTAQKGQAARDSAALRSATAHAINAIAPWIAACGALVIGLTEPSLSAAHLTVVLLGVMVLLPLSAFETTSNMPQAFLQYFTSSAAAHRLRAVGSAQSNESSTVNFREFGSTGQKNNTARDISTAQKRLALTQQPLSAYDSTTDNHPSRQNPLLVAKDLVIGYPGTTPLGSLNLKIYPGDRLFITGESGIGKTMLLSTLSGSLAPLSGELTSSLGAVNADAPGTITAFTPEDAHLFDTTIEENLRVARGDATENDMMQALAHLDAQSWIEELPEGLQTPLYSGQAALSGGERRKILLARALLHNAPLVLLDEPTEHLDPVMAEELMSRILAPGDADNALFDADHAVIVVSHNALPEGAHPDLLSISFTDGKDDPTSD